MIRAFCMAKRYLAQWYLTHGLDSETFAMRLLKTATATSIATCSILKTARMEDTSRQENQHT